MKSENFIKEYNEVVSPQKKTPPTKVISLKHKEEPWVTVM